MQPVLIAFASTEGHGAQIARHLKKAVELHGVDAVLLDVRSDFDEINAAMFGPQEETRNEDNGEAASPTTPAAAAEAADSTSSNDADANADDEYADYNSQDREPIWSGAIVVGSIHFGAYDTELYGFAKRFGRLLSSKPSAFLSVSLSAASNDMASRMSVDATAHTLLLESDWLPSKLLHVAGAVREKELNFFKRGALQAVLRAKGIKPDPSGITVFTDWPALDQFVDEFMPLIARQEAKST